MTRRWLEECLHPPDHDEQIMCAIDEVLDGYGVEIIEAQDWQDNRYGFAVASYCNRGDTYEPTVIHDFENAAYYCTSMGDFVEALEAQGRRLK